MVRSILIVTFILSVINVNSQRDMLSIQEDYIQSGLLKASSTISPSTMLSREVGNIYVSGFLEYHTEKKISLRGESYFFIDGHSRNGSNNEFIHQGVRTYFGAFYHWNKSNWDKYLGFEPGISLMRPLDVIEVNAPLQASPSFAIHAGTSYYVWKYFHFFLDVAYVRSSYRGLSTGSVNTDELILSAGLGFQINTKRK